LLEFVLNNNYFVVDGTFLTFKRPLAIPSDVSAALLTFTFVAILMLKKVIVF